MISPVTEQDFDRLFEIEQVAHLVPWSKGTLLNNQGERYLNLKLTESTKENTDNTSDQRIIAFAICQVVLDEATLFNIAVTPTAQGKGYGKQLLQHLITQLQAKHVHTLWLEVRESNTHALNLYRSLGFNEVTLRKNYYPTPTGERENAVVMACYL